MRPALFCITLLVLSVAASAQTIIIEATQGGAHLEWYQEIAGTWFDSVAKSQAAGCTPNIGSRFCIIDEERRGGKARFTPQLPSPGEYEVFVTWGRSGNAYNTKYTVMHQGGEKAIYLDQDGWAGAGGPSNANEWISLGTYQFDAGNSAYVEVSDEENKGKPSTINSGRVYTDACMFVKGGTQTQATPPTAVTVPPSVAPSPPRVAPVSTTVGGVRWYTDVSTAQQAAMTQNKKILVYFYTVKSRGCQRYEQEVFSRPEVVTTFNARYICIRFDLARQPNQAYNLGAYRAPTLISYNARGTPLGKIDGFFATDEFLSRLRLY